MRLVYYIHVAKCGGKLIDLSRVKRWLTLCAINRRYTGRLESDLSEDIGLLKEGKDIDAVAGKYPVKAVDESYFNSKAREYEQISCTLLADA